MREMVVKVACEEIEVDQQDMLTMVRMLKSELEEKDKKIRDLSNQVVVLTQTMSKVKFDDSFSRV